MGARAPKRSRVGLQASVTMKPKPKALKAGMAPINSEAITPAKIRTTVSAAASDSQWKRLSPAPARRAISARSQTLAGCGDVSLKLISVKMGPKPRTGEIHTRPAPRTSQSCKAFVTVAGSLPKTLSVNAKYRYPGLNPVRPGAVNPVWQFLSVSEDTRLHTAGENLSFRATF